MNLSTLTWYSRIFSFWLMLFWLILLIPDCHAQVSPNNNFQPWTAPPETTTGLQAQRRIPDYCGSGLAVAVLPENFYKLRNIVAALTFPGWNVGPTEIFSNGTIADKNDSTKTGSEAAASVDNNFSRLASEMDGQKLAILQEFGCNHLLRRTWQRGDRRIIVKVFQFDTIGGAYGAYFLLREGASTVLQRGDASSEDDQCISFWQNNVFVNIYGTSLDDEESKGVISTFADKIASQLSGHAGVPPIIAQLPRLELVRGSERVVMGPQGARKFFPAPFVNALDFSRGCRAAVADYQTQEPYHERLKVLYMEYNNPQVAYAAYNAYTALLTPHAIDVSPMPSAMTSMYKISGGYLLCRLRGQQIVIISGARKKPSALLLSMRL